MPLRREGAAEVARRTGARDGRAGRAEIDAARDPRHRLGRSRIRPWPSARRLPASSPRSISRKATTSQQGQVLFTLDRRPLEAALQQARSEPASATSRRRRTPRPAPSGIRISPSAASPRANRWTPRATGAAALERDGRGRSRGRRERQGPAAVRDDRGADLRPHRRADGARGQSGPRQRHRRRSSIINQVTPINVSFAIPESRLPELKRYMAQGTLQRRGQRRPTRTARRRWADRLRRQRGRSDDRHDHGSRARFPNERSPSVARPVRQRRGHADDRPDRDRRPDRGGPDRPAGPVRVRGQGGPDGGNADPVVDRAHAGDETVVEERAASRARRWSPTASCGWSPGSRISIKEDEAQKVAP